MMRVICYGDSNAYGYDPRSYCSGRYPADSRWADLLVKKIGGSFVVLMNFFSCFHFSIFAFYFSELHFRAAMFIAVENTGLPHANVQPPLLPMV